MTPLAQNQIFEGVILSKEDSKKHYRVWIEDRKGVLPFSEMAWALHTKPTPHFKPGKVKDPSELLKPGDVVHLRVKDSSRKDLGFVVSLEQEPLVQGALLCVDPRNGYVKAILGAGTSARANLIVPSIPGDNQVLPLSPSFMPLPWRKATILRRF